MHAQPPITLARYRLVAPIGIGAMGVVSRAYDRLTGQEVALKQVNLPPGLSPAEIERELITLAHEFQLLASLRHPHIISVLDYGFDAARRPFYTMELLDGAQPILAAGRGLPAGAQVALLTEAAEALAYLHRRGVLHHDLKPANVLVCDGSARLLDFGLSVLAAQQRDDDAFGTLQYLAPEVLHGRAYTEAADLYSLGVIAYELLVGQHPFAAATGRAFIDQVLTRLPDVAAIAAEHPALASVIGQLLAKQPDERPPSAEAAIAALRAAIGHPANESPAVRESYLQAAAFVGRAAELETLLDALERMRAGRGSAWLIGGESGVGKSRLLREVETRALIGGAIVIRGQAASEGGGDLQLWRDALSQLIIHHPAVDELTAGVLLPYIPRIAELLERPVTPAPAVDERAARNRLQSSVAQLFRTFGRPLLVLLEDLQWAGESLMLLQAVSRLAASHPLLILGTYRHDERPGLAAELPEMRRLALERLSPNEVEQLSVAILGDAGRQPALLARLQEESEGNTFFLVEIVRALAEDAGRLADISHMDLPERLLPHGIQTAIGRRLGRVPASAQPLLAYAAVIGRQIDLTLLEALAPEVDVARWWLPLCAESGILEVQNERWQFTHEKLRDALVAQLTPAHLRRLHAAVAEALERRHPADASYAGQLAYHWGQAGSRDRELEHSLRGGEHARQLGRIGEAIRLFSRAIAIAPPENTRRRGELHLQRGNAQEIAGAWAYAEADYRAALGLAGSPRSLADAQLALGSLHRLRSEHSAALEWLARAEGHYRQLDDARGLARVLDTIGRVWEQQGAYAQARASTESAIRHARDAGDEAAIAQSLWNLGNIAIQQSDYARARALLEESLARFRTLGDREGAGRSLSALGKVAYARGEYAAAHEMYATCLEQWRAIGHKDLVAEALVLLGNAVSAHGDNDAAQAYYAESLAIAREIGNQQRVARALNNIGNIALAHGDLPEARRLLEESLALRRALNDSRGVVSSLNNLADVAAVQGDSATAHARYAESLTLGLAIGDTESIAYNLAGLAYLAAQLGGYTVAAQLAAATASVLTSIDGELQPDTQSWLDAAVSSARAALGAAAFDAAYSRGGQLSVEAVVGAVVTTMFGELKPGDLAPKDNSAT